MTKKITAIIITKNEEIKIRKCIENILFCDEILILDSGSTDKTLEIAREYKCNIQTNENWPGFGLQKQRALDLATHDWILSIDADEVVSEPLKERILNIVRDPGQEKYSAYKIKRINRFLGKELRYGGWGKDILLRLGKRCDIFFTKDEIHESLKSKGRVGYIDEPLYHDARYSLKELLEKQSRYIIMSNETKSHIKKGPRPFLSAVSSVGTFFNYYILRLGFLDGKYGFFAAASKAQGKFWKNSGLR